LALSGGKDSAALAVYMREKYPEIPMEYVFTDSGSELPETYDYLNRIRAILNIKITTIRSPRNFDYWLKWFNGVLPSPSNRWCTRLLKLRPYNNWLKNKCSGTRIFSYVGFRADEDREGYQPSADDLTPIYPFVDDGLVLKDIKRILKDTGLDLPSYYSWRQRSGCYFCFFQRGDEWRGLRTHHPDLFEKACEYEEKHSDGRLYFWRDIPRNSSQPRSLRDLSKEVSNKAVKDKKCRPLLVNSLADISIGSYKSKSLIQGGKR